MGNKKKKEDIQESTNEKEISFLHITFHGERIEVHYKDINNEPKLISFDDLSENQRENLNNLVNSL